MGRKWEKEERRRGGKEGCVCVGEGGWGAGQAPGGGYGIDSR